MNPQPETATFPGLIDLASERLGGKALMASDEFFAEKENLLKPGRGIFIADKYTENGKWMDGWESRRKRTPGYDWCIIRLGVSGLIHGVDIDTNHFLGNHPPYASVEACCIETDIDVVTLNDPKTEWTEILPRSPLRPGSQNLFTVHSETRWTHLRLNIYPDGGVARFRVFGDVVPEWERYRPDTVLDLAAIEHGGKVVACSDMFFGPKENLIMPGRGINMGDGWETKRRRGPGYDWVVIELGASGRLSKVELDTAHFKGNYPDRFSLEGCFQPGIAIDSLTQHDIPWYTLLPESKLQADSRHLFEKEILNPGPWSHVKLNIFPDGGVSRLRLFGTRVSTANEASRSLSGSQSQ